jgi:hypothetical protein
MRIDGEQVRLSASDVANFLACRHLTRLDLLRARGVISPPHPYDAGFEDLVARGEAHEKEVLQGFRDRGLQVVDLSPYKGPASFPPEARYSVSGRLAGLARLLVGTVDRASASWKSPGADLELMPNGGLCAAQRRARPPVPQPVAVRDGPGGQ